MTAGGAYILVLSLREARRLPVGNLGVLPLPAGPYAYAGGARTGLAKRLLRHRERGKPVVAHVDALTEAADVVGDAVYPGAEACAASDHLARGEGARPVIGFGATGCACLTHLFAFPGREAADVLAYATGWTR